MKKSAVTILGLCALGLVGVGFEQSSAAIEFSSRTNVGFNFNEVLSVNISGDIEINGLAVGQSKDSDAVEIVVRTNALGGYVLGATVGTDANRNSDLAYSVSSVTDKKFTNIATDADLVSLNTNNTWGYKVSEDDSVWSNYNGLALIGGDQSILREKSEMPSGGSETTYFKIGAKASADIVPGDYTNSITFYAVTKAFVATLSTIATMQEMTPDVCTASSEGETAQLQDTRDNKYYYVAKLLDGKCWMLDNLALDLTNSDVQANLTSSTTNASDTSLGYLKNGGGTTSDKYATAAVANWTSSSYSYSAPLMNMGSEITIPSDALSTAGGWKVGGYYNYCAASAGSYCYGNGTSAGTSENNATEDICPKGWRMPGGGSTIALTDTPPTGEYQNLYNQYNNYTNFRNALHLPLSGYFYYGSALDQGSYGRFWSSTRYNDIIMYNLRANTSSVGPAFDYSCVVGFSVRCVAGS